MPNFLKIFWITCKKVAVVLSNSCPSCLRTICNFYLFVSLCYLKNFGLQSFNGQLVAILVVKGVLNIILQSRVESELQRTTFTFKRIVVVYCPFLGSFQYFWSIWSCFAKNFISKYSNINFKLSIGCKAISSWRFLLCLSYDGITVDSASNSSSDVVSLSKSETSPSRISSSCPGFGSLVLFSLFLLCFIVSPLFLNFTCFSAYQISQFFKNDVSFGKLHDSILLEFELTDLWLVAEKQRLNDKWLNTKRSMLKKIKFLTLPWCS